MGGGDCGIGFEIGQSYFVDAGRYGNQQHLGTSICSSRGQKNGRKACSERFVPSSRISACLIYLEPSLMTNTCTASHRTTLHLYHSGVSLSASLRRVAKPIQPLPTPTAST